MWHDYKISRHPGSYNKIFIKVDRHTDTHAPNTCIYVSEPKREKIVILFF